MPEPGLYLINATGETVPVHTERHRDLQLLAEYLVENDLEDVVDETRVKMTGETAMTDGGQEPQRSGAWLGELEGIGVRDPGPDADGPIVELHGAEGMAAIEVASEEVVDQLSHTAAEVQLALDEQEEA